MPFVPLMDVYTLVTGWAENKETEDEEEELQLEESDWDTDFEVAHN